MAILTHNQKGFTLIEALVYIALLTLLMGGAVVTCYGILESSGRNQTQAIVQEEGDFLIAKINWALSNIHHINYPAVGGTGTSLTTTKWDNAIGAVTIALSGTEVTLARGGGSAYPLTASNVSVSDLTFTHEWAGGVSPESVIASFTIATKTPNGMPITQNFTTTVHVRR